MYKTDPVWMELSEDQSMFMSKVARDGNAVWDAGVVAEVVVVRGSYSCWIVGCEM